LIIVILYLSEKLNSLIITKVCSLDRDALMLVVNKDSARSEALAEYWIHITARFGGVHALGHNSAESEPIWMDDIWSFLSTLSGLVLADFGHDHSRLMQVEVIASQSSVVFWRHGVDHRKFATK